MLTKIFKSKPSKTGLKILFFLLMFLFLLLGCAKENAQQIVGGACKYTIYEGKARIVELEPMSQTQADDMARIKVKFIFIPDRTVEEKLFNPQKHYIMYDKKLAYPNRKFVQQNHLHPNQTIRAQLWIISQGTCSPVEFNFPDLIDH